MSVQITLALTEKVIFVQINVISISPSAGIGRQSDLKIRWCITVNVQVVSWINVLYLKTLFLLFFIMGI